MKEIEYKKIHEYNQYLYNLIKDFEFDKFLIVLRGGMFLYHGLTELNSKYKDKDISFIGISSYENNKQKQLFEYFSTNIKTDNKYLILEDIVDTGNTISYLLDNYKIENYKILTYFKSKDIKLNNCIFAEENECWIKFPWEK